MSKSIKRPYFYLLLISALLLFASGYWYMRPIEQYKPKKVVLKSTGIEAIDTVVKDSLHRPQFVVFLRHFG